MIDMISPKTKSLMTVLAIAVLSSCMNIPEHRTNSLRPSAYPLITIDPYTSGWSFTDHLYDDVVRHWSGNKFPLLGVLTVDGVDYRFMGQEEPVCDVIVADSENEAWNGRYVTANNDMDWMNPDYDDSSWKSGNGAFGTRSYEPTVGTEWSGGRIWVRREFEWPENLEGRDVYLRFSNDDEVVIYINGVEAAHSSRCNKNEIVKLSPEVVSTLNPGKNVIAATCYDYGWCAFLDFALLAKRHEAEIYSRTAVQTSADVQATQTHYTFTCGPVDLKLTFMAPLLLDDLELVSRPVNYISYEVSANDGSEHDVAVYFEASPEWATFENAETVNDGFSCNGLTFVKTGTVSQKILERRGDHVTIDWGYFHMAAEDDGVQTDVEKLGLMRDLGHISDGDGFIMIGYDDIYSIQYFGENLRPYWNRDGNRTIVDMFTAAEKEYESLKRRCERFDNEMMAEATAKGGSEYAELCAAAYRQAISAHKLVVSPEGELLFLSKENFSNGSIGTVDITYPSAPLFLRYNPELVKGLMNHIFHYSESGRWTKPFAAHDVGTYPQANGQTYDGDMPIEESGNMLILAAAIAHEEGNADYAVKHWQTLTTWKDYLVEHGLDPENQLCTDDFAGHSAHNANLSIKAILGIASYGYLAGMSGDRETEEKYISLARDLALQWMEMADDGDHYRLTFDRPGTWSQKYNLVWDKIFGWNIFPDSVRQKEIAYYLCCQNKYGLPLDCRQTYTKTDWVMWTAAMADDKETFGKFVSPLWNFMNETVDRLPMSDWVFTDKPEHRAFRARAVVGGYCMKMLEN